VIETDDALVRKAQQRDRAAFEELVRRTGRLLYSRFFLDTGNAHQAEDLVQETFLVAWRSIGQVTDASGFRTWLLTLARSVLIDAGRRAGRKKRFGIRVNLQAADQMTDRGKSPAEQAEEEESRQQALETLRALPEEYRLPLTLRYIAGADYETIGRQLGLSNGSLRGLLTRGMAKLREQMQEKVS
jgi:RNA polymerase sigma-70 factor (ECF subfamily)